MIARNANSFIFGVDAYPEWFKNIDAKYETDAAGELVAVSIMTPKGMVRAKVGETILSLPGGLMAVIPKDAAERYMDEKTETKEETE